MQSSLRAREPVKNRTQCVAQSQLRPRSAAPQRRPHRPAAWVYLALLLGALLACKQQEPQAGSASGGPAAAQQKPTGPLRVTGDLDITLTPQADGATLQVSGSALTLTQVGTNLEVKEGDARLAKFSSESDRIKLFGPDGTTLTHKLKFKADGKLELEDAAGARLYIAKPKDYGFKVSDASDAPVVSVKNKGSRFEAKRESGEEVWRTEGSVSAKAASVLGFEKLDAKLRGALLYLVSKRP